MKNPSEQIVIKLSGSTLECDTYDIIIDEIMNLVREKIQVILVHGGGKQLNNALGEKIKDNEGHRRTAPEQISQVTESAAIISSKIHLACTNLMPDTNVSIFDEEHPIIIGSAPNNENYCSRNADVQVHPNFSEELLQTDLIIIPYLSWDEKRKSYLNTNADTVAGAVAREIQAPLICFGAVIKNQHTGYPFTHDQITYQEQAFLNNGKNSLPPSHDIMKKLDFVKRVTEGNKGVPIHLFSQENYIPDLHAIVKKPTKTVKNGILVVPNLI